MGTRPEVLVPWLGSAALGFPRRSPALHAVWPMHRHVLCAGYATDLVWPFSRSKRAQNMCDRLAALRVINAAATMLLSTAWGPAHYVITKQSAGLGGKSGGLILHSISTPAFERPGPPHTNGCSSYNLPRHTEDIPPWNLQHASPASDRGLLVASSRPHLPRQAWLDMNWSTMSLPDVSLVHP